MRQVGTSATWPISRRKLPIRQVGWHTWAGMATVIDTADHGRAADLRPGAPNNLPVQLTSFVGRRAELDDIRDLLRRNRLVTLTGPGGSGKTRLAGEVATAELSGPFSDGIWWVDLAELSDGADVADAAAVALDVLVEPSRGARGSITRHLARAHVLLCIDNAEHVLEDVAALVEAVLRECPHVTLLVTSREPLNVPGEAVWRVPPLADDEAVSLFVERGNLVRPGFTLDDASETAIRSIAMHLDGIPLALELAAAWLRTLTPQLIEASLDNRFALLVRGPRGAQRRQATLAGSVDWSHALLDDPDRIVFRRLAVFSGPFGLAAARTICAGGSMQVDEVLPALGRLVDKSLVIAEELEGQSRYRLLETIRAYAAARLIEAREDREFRDRHLAWAGEFAESIDSERVVDPDGWRRSLRSEYHNLRAALERGLAADDPEPGRRIAAALAWLWHLGRQGREGIGYLRRAIERVPDDRSRLQAGLLTGLALVADTAEPLDLEYDAATRALELATEVSDESLRALCLNLAAVGAFYTDFEAAWELCEEAHRAAEAGGNAFVLGGSRALQAIILHLRDHHFEAEELVDEAVRRHLELHRGVLSTVVGFEAHGALATGAPSRAMELAAEALRIAEPLRDYLRVGFARATLAYVRALTGDLAGAQASIEPVLRLLEGADESVFVPGVGRAMGALSLRLGDPEAAAGWYAREAGSMDRGLETYLAAQSLPGLGAALGALGRRSEAADAFDRAVELATRLDMPGALADALEGQADMAATAPDGIERAVELAHAALAARWEHGLRGSVPDSLESIARLGSLQDPSADDVRLLSASETARRSMGLSRDPDRQSRVDETIARLRDRLGDGFDDAWAEGTELPLDDAVAYARRSRGARRRPATGWASLTPTELEVVRLAVEGLSNPEIGARLFMSRGTVKTHLGHVFGKLDVANRTELARAATAHLS